ncbi:hypothetical protein ACIQUS_20550 [Pseudomonas sp. NPDC090755]|uniref:hypothetical protein n=1 Tax=Pseudomonas sp. NPDC090755 TaxID=3364481 RepID=UPI00383AD9F9
MKKLHVVVLSATLGIFGVGAAIADEVISREGDTTAGAGYGAGTGMLVGGAVGGPVGALLGAGVGLLIGSGVQSATGLEENAYKVRDSSGKEQVVRSPGDTFAIGQQVEMSGIRLRATTP